MFDTDIGKVGKMSQVYDIDTAPFSSYSLYRRSIRVLRSPFTVRLRFLQSGRMHQQEVLWQTNLVLLSLSGIPLIISPTLSGTERRSACSRSGFPPICK